jgi:hypothetical protein
MRQVILKENKKLQTLGSRISELSTNRKIRPKPTLCSFCATASFNETNFRRAYNGEGIEISSMSEVANRAQEDQCPLCQVALHDVSQALASPQAGDIWPQSNLAITLYPQTGTVQRIGVRYHDIKVGCIALYHRTLQDGFDDSVKRLDHFSDSHFNIRLLRPILGEIFKKNGLFHVSCQNIGRFAVKHFSRKLDVKTADYRSTQLIRRPFHLRILIAGGVCSVSVTGVWVFVI